jgi:hypothetical protein
MRSNRVFFAISFALASLKRLANSLPRPGDPTADMESPALLPQHDILLMLKPTMRAAEQSFYSPQISGGGGRGW